MATKRKSVKGAKKVTSAHASTNTSVQQPTSRKRTTTKQAASARPSAEEVRSKQHAHRRRWPLVVVSTLCAVVVVVVAAFSWDRWLRYDDAAEIQGEWQVGETTSSIVIDSHTIKLTSDVSYEYTLDAGAKTIAFSFGGMEGSARYYFSPDRTQLIIEEGGNPTWWSTLGDDIARAFDYLGALVQGASANGPVAGETTTVLHRLSHNTAATPSKEAVASGGNAAAPSNVPPANEQPSEGSEEGNAQGDADPGVPATPGDVLDVNDVPA